MQGAHVSRRRRLWNTDDARELASSSGCIFCAESCGRIQFAGLQKRFCTCRSRPPPVCTGQRRTRTSFRCQRRHPLQTLTAGRSTAHPTLKDPVLHPPSLTQYSAIRTLLKPSPLTLHFRPFQGPTLASVMSIPPPRAQKPLCTPTPSIQHSSPAETPQARL